MILKIYYKIWVDCILKIQSIPINKRGWNSQSDRFTNGALVYNGGRGREQMMIDAYGGVGSPAVGNTKNGIWHYNPFRPLYLGTAQAMFGPVTF